MPGSVKGAVAFLWMGGLWWSDQPPIVCSFYFTFFQMYARTTQQGNSTEIELNAKIRKMNKYNSNQCLMMLSDA